MGMAQDWQAAAVRLGSPDLIKIAELL